MNTVTVTLIHVLELYPFQTYKSSTIIQCNSASNERLSLSQCQSPSFFGRWGGGVGVNFLDHLFTFTQLQISS